MRLEFLSLASTLAVALCCLPGCSTEQAYNSAQGWQTEPGRNR